jgi:hypothetical protein
VNSMGREEIRRGPGERFGFWFWQRDRGNTKRAAGDIRKWGRPRHHCRVLSRVLVEIKLIAGRPWGLSIRVLVSERIEI